MDTLKIPIDGPVLTKKYLCVDNQEQTLAGVFRFHSIVSTLDGSLYAQVQHMTDAQGQSLFFRMSLLDMTKLKDQYDSFSREGLLGWWKLLREDSLSGLPPRIQLQEAVIVDNMEAFQSVVLHTSSAPFIRDIQVKLLPQAT